MIAAVVKVRNSQFSAVEAHQSQRILEIFARIFATIPLGPEGSVTVKKKRGAYGRAVGISHSTRYEWCRFPTMPCSRHNLNPWLPHVRVGTATLPLSFAIDIAAGARLSQPRSRSQLCRQKPKRPVKRLGCLRLAFGQMESHTA